IFAFIFFIISGSSISVAQKLQMKELTCEDQDNPIGIDIKIPYFSWKLVSSQRNIKQKTYEIRTSTDANALVKGKNILWQTGAVSSDQSIHIPYSGPELNSRQRYYWQVKISDNTGATSAWSEVKFWEMGLLNSTDWIASWIEPNIPGDSVGQPSPLLRNDFEVKKTIRSARLYITSHGLYEAHLNGQRVGDQYLTPGWTSYNKRLQYQTYDVTKLLKAGQNAVGVMLGDGWYRGFLAWENNKNIYGKKLGLLCQLEVEYSDGVKETFGSDEKWKCSTGPITKSGIYYGETYDARLEPQQWSNAGFNDGNWLSVSMAAGGKDNLVASYAPPIRKHESFKALKISKTPNGQTVVDFGQNLVGWIKLAVSGNAGHKITIHHAEVLDKHENFYTENLRAAEQEIQYILKGTGQEVYEPRFSFFGFRYIRVEGFPGELKPENITAFALYSDMSATGKFSTSNPLINQLQHNIQWGQKGNFVDVPTDCPQRDERLGWTGDAQAFSRTATFNMNVASFFKKWLKDLSADQVEDGRVPFVIPNVLGKNASASAGWADAATIIPWNIYMAYGDKRILEQQYESMKAWVAYIEKTSINDLWNTGFHFGDWLFYRPLDDNDGRAAVTDKYLIAQCFWAYSTQLMIQTATVLDKKDDIIHYTNSLKKIKEAFVKEYTTPSGRLVSGTQTAYVLALRFDMLPENLRAQAADRLAQNIKDYGNHLTTGFLGTPYLCEVLTRFSHADLAYTLLLQETYPSWLYPVKMGATTIWERWDGIKTDSTFQTPGMNSFNHYAYGAIGDWMYRTVAGLSEGSPGYKEIKIAPKPGGKLTRASAEFISPYGLTKSSWTIDNDLYTLDVIIPANSTAVVVLPKAASKKVTERSIDINKVNVIKDITTAGEDVTLTLGSGTYRFEYTIK
ncbi:MAG TPA: glycoside hydrolase family 78 protein, partial [Chryseolinea sp.]|nr:glycoside hydrolase family 78 protein [Chryseolinea sp.]